MPTHPGAALRFTYAWIRPPGGLAESEVWLQEPDSESGPTSPGSGSRVAATLILPRHFHTPLPGWVAFHGITRSGRHHPSLLRFARSLAASGAAVLIPEVARWRALELAPDEALPTLQAAVGHLRHHPFVDPERLAAVGFSFGAPHLVRAALHPSLASRLRGVGWFGGYAQLDSTLEFLFTGVHRWGATEHRKAPDSYGRWVVGSRYLTAIPGWEDRGEVARALWTLAARSGDLTLPAGHPTLDRLRAELSRPMPPAARALFHHFAPPGNELPPAAWAGEVLPMLATAVREGDPLMEPGLAAIAEEALERGAAPRIHLLHGKEDALIPHTETLLMARDLEALEPTTSITGLFAHSEGMRSVGGVRRQLREARRFLRALGHFLALPDSAPR